MLTTVRVRCVIPPSEGRATTMATWSRHLGIFDRISKALRAPRTRTVKLAPWFDPVEPAVKTALSMAERDGKPLADLSDLLWALSFEESLEGLLAKFDVDFERLRDALSLARAPALDKGDAEPPRHGVLPNDEMVAVLRLAAGQAIAKGAKAVTPLDVFLAALHQGGCPAVKAFERFGLTRFSVVMMLSHGVVAHRLEHAAYADDDEVLVVMWNDDFTTMEFVLETLTETFGMDKGEAKGIMMEVHNHVRATVAIWPAARAKAAVIEVMASAKDHACPLKLTLEKAHN